MPIQLIFSDALINGPMLSDLTFREAQIWVQTDKKSKVSIHYFEKNNPSKIFITPKIETKEENGFIANLSLFHIEPNRTYTYCVEINGKLSLDKYTFDSLIYFYDRQPPPDINVAVLGAHYAVEPEFEPPYRELGNGYSIFNRVYKTNPNLVLWAGNTAHLRESDISSKSGYIKRFSHARSYIKPKALLAEILNLGIWSSNDYGDFLDGKEMSMKALALETFSLFWPKTKLVKHHNSLCYSHKLSDAEFFFLDVQSQRNINTNDSKKKSILGEEQIEWLKDSLLKSTAKFKIVVSGSPVLNPSQSPKNISIAYEERQRFFEFIKSKKIPGILFISGGSYKGELTRVVHSTHYSFYDLTIGPCTAIPIKEDNELNFYRIPGTNTFEQQYVMLKISGKEENRKLEIEVYSLAGIKLWSKTIRASALKI